MSHVDLKYFGLAATVGDITLNPGDVFRVTSKGSYLTLAKKLDGKVMSADIDWKVAEELYNFSNEFRPVTSGETPHVSGHPIPKEGFESQDEARDWVKKHIYPNEQGYHPETESLAHALSVLYPKHKSIKGKVMSADIDWKVAEELYNFSNEFKPVKLKATPYEYSEADEVADSIGAHKIPKEGFKNHDEARAWVKKHVFPQGESEGVIDNVAHSLHKKYKARASVTAARAKHQLTRPTPKRAREPEPKEESRERGRPAGTGGRKSKRVYKYHGEDVVVHDIHTGGRAKRVTIAKHDRIILHPLNRKNSDKYTHVRLHHGERQHIITKEEADHLVDNSNREYPHSKAKEFGDKHGFQWHSYHGRSFSLASKHGKLSLRLEPGHKVGLREYLTDENKFKLLHPLHGRARLFTIDRKTAERIKRNSKASNRVTK